MERNSSRFTVNDTSEKRGHFGFDVVVDLRFYHVLISVTVPPEGCEEAIAPNYFS